MFDRHIPQPTNKQLEFSFAAYCACVWSFVFAAASFYWAAGGTIGVHTIGETITDFAQSAWFIWILWGTGILKALCGLLALALIRPWGRSIPRWMLFIAALGTGVLLTLYGGANLVVRGLMAVGVMNTPESMRSVAARWHLLLWDPWWLLGGILYIWAACIFIGKGNNRIVVKQGES